jgi:proteasome accessory factor BC
VSHDTDKLIRQLSLVAFLMAERRPLTARDIKSNVEGYQEMSDEAFARRFYSDRAELVALGVPLDSQRDEFTGEELYTLRSERYFLPELELDDDELAALQTCFYLLEGRFAYAEPLRLALQNLALGRSAGSMAAPPTGTAGRVEVRDPDYSPELQGRLGKLEGAISKQRTVKFRYWSIYRDEEEERSLNPYALLPENGSWYVIGFDLERKDIRTFRVARIRSDIRFATRRERDFRLPPEFDVENYRGRAEWQFGDVVGEARVEVAPDTAWWVKRVYDGPRNRLEDDVFVTEYASLALLARWILRQDGRAIPLEPSELRRLVTEGARAARRAHEGPAAEPVAEIPREIAETHTPGGPRDPVGARVRRADGRCRRPLPTRTCPRETRGDLRRVRPGADALAAHRRRRGSRREADAGDRRAQARGDRVPEAGGAGGCDAHGRAVFDRAPAAVLVRPHLGHRA